MPATLVVEDVAIGVTGKATEKGLPGSVNRCAGGVEAGRGRGEAAPPPAPRTTRGRGAAARGRRAPRAVPSHQAPPSGLICTPDGRPPGSPVGPPPWLTRART